ncbi:T9SS type A sorting domain-containing protein, partial [candidate division KSB1 bacterium]|nr:T9SS type A sorting domain-containing protein [candidate division KSB1 bacterium]
WSDQRNGDNDTDIWLAKSTDHGQTWSAPIRVNDDGPGRQQFFTWMTIDQANGALYFVFYDRRNYGDNRTDVFMAVSQDGGESFINFKVSASPFTPREEIFFGDYTNVAAHNNVVRPIWTRLHNAELSMMTALIDLDAITKVEDRSEPAPQTHALAQNFPNPFAEATYLSFKLHGPAIISLKIYDLLGKEVTTVIDRKPYGIGQYIESFVPKEFHLPSGTYYYVLQNGSELMKKKMIYVK